MNAWTIVQASAATGLCLEGTSPSSVYSVKPDELHSALEALPLRASDRLYWAVLKRARKG